MDQAIQEIRFLDTGTYLLISAESILATDLRCSTGLDVQMKQTESRQNRRPFRCCFDRAELISVCALKPYPLPAGIFEPEHAQAEGLLSATREHANVYDCRVGWEQSNTRAQRLDMLSIE